MSDAPAIPRQRAERTIPATSIPDWVALSVSPRALAAYWVVKAAPPGTVSVGALARILGYSRSDRATAVVAELVAAGAVTITHRSWPTRKILNACTMPPPGYTGPVDAAVALADRLADWVYYAARANGDIKIGTAQDLTWRLQQLQRQHGPMTLLGREPGSTALEEQRHAEFDAIRCPPDASGTEWFLPDPALTSHIESLAPRSSAEAAR
jgi:hypothetical protein